jgi:hypothetical protein
VFELLPDPMLRHSAPCAVTSQAVLTLAGREISLQDILDTDSETCGLVEVTPGAPIAQIAGVGRRAELSRGQLASLARRQHPGLTISCGSPEECAVTVTVVTRGPGDGGEPRCSVLVTSKASGELVAPEDAAPADCLAAAGTAALEYDAGARVLRAARPLEPGTHLGRVRPAAPPEHFSGETVTIATVVGPVRVEQNGVLLQAARPGEVVFVRTASGAALPVQLPVLQEVAE